MNQRAKGAKRSGLDKSFASAMRGRQHAAGARIHKFQFGLASVFRIICLDFLLETRLLPAAPASPVNRSRPFFRPSVSAPPPPLSSSRSQITVYPCGESCRDLSPFPLPNIDYSINISLIFLSLASYFLISSSSHY